MKRRSSFTAVPTAIDRNIDDTLLDYLKKISDNSEELSVIGSSSLIELTEEEITNLLDVVAAAELVRDLDFTVVSVPWGTPASVVFNGSIAEFRVPMPKDGEKGEAGLSPILDISYVNVILSIALDGYSAEPTTVKEI